MRSGTDHLLPVLFRTASVTRNGVLLPLFARMATYGHTDFHWLRNFVIAESLPMISL